MDLVVSKSTAFSEHSKLELQDDNIPPEPPAILFAGDRTPASPAAARSLFKWTLFWTNFLVPVDSPTALSSVCSPGSTFGRMRISSTLESEFCWSYQPSRLRLESCKINAQWSQAWAKQVEDTNFTRVLRIPQPVCRGDYQSALPCVRTVSLSALYLSIYWVSLRRSLARITLPYRFGKGMMPKAYHLNMNAMALIMDHWASQLAEQYGVGVASEVIARTRSNLQLDCISTLSYNSGTQTPGTASGSLPKASLLREEDALLENDSTLEMKKS
ncbi:hypothetical protein ACEPAG_8378 [Sanghuangporus baumii]